MMPKKVPLNVLNYGCYQYLKQMAELYPEGKGRMALEALKSESSISRHEKEKYQKILSILKSMLDGRPFSPKTNYQRRYQQLHELAETLESIPKVEALKQFRQQFFIKLFENDNKIHHEIYAKVIQPNATVPASKKEIHQRQKKHTKKHFKRTSHPEHPLNKFFSGVHGIGYHPLKKNNVPYINYKLGERTNLRIGAQVNSYSAHINPSFIQYLAAKKEADPKKPFHHVYINLQKRDEREGEGWFDRNLERPKEKKRTVALEALEKNAALGVAVVTLPADGHFFFKNFSHKTGYAKNNHQESLSTLKQELIDAIKNNKRDFYFSDEVKKRVLGQPIDKTVSELFQQAAKDILGAYHPGMKVEPALRQAILFHFIKFHLTNHILNQLNPSTFNISCKDNIDRGGVHNLWHYLMTQINDVKVSQISIDDFQRNLDASAMLVKDRPMNDHRNVIWNALYQQFLHQPQKIVHKMPWVADWLSRNIPLNPKVERALDQGKEINSETIKKIESIRENIKEIYVKMKSDVQKKKMKEEDTPKIEPLPKMQAPPPPIVPTFSTRTRALLIPPEPEGEKIKPPPALKKR